MFKKDKDDKEKENPFVEETDINTENQENIDETEDNENFSELKSKLEKIEEEKQIVDTQYIRLAADFDNFRKRQEQERESLLKYGAEDTLKKLLPVIDTLERAQQSLKTIEDPEKLKESFEAVQKQFMDVLEKLGVEKIATVGCEFDPNVHEAVMQTPTEEHPDHSIIVELQSGYKLSDKVLRPALVNVAVNE